MINQGNPHQMTTNSTVKMKGLLKGIKYISQLFVHKEHEMEIGYPTNVKHVSHIGFDGQFGSAPSWMSEFKSASDHLSPSSLSINPVSRETSWISEDFVDLQSSPPAMFADQRQCPEIPKAPKKSKRKKGRTTSRTASINKTSMLSSVSRVS